MTGVPRRGCEFDYAASYDALDVLSMRHPARRAAKLDDR